MPQIDNIYLLSAGVELFAAAIMGILLLGYCMEDSYRYRDQSSRLFFFLLIMQTSLLLIDAIIWVLLYDPASDKVPLVKSLTLITDFMTVILTAVYAYLLAHYIAQRKPISFAFPRIVSAICGVVLILWVLCLFNDWYIWYGADGSQHEGTLYPVIWILGILLLISCVLFTLWHRKALGKKDTLILSTYGIFPIVGDLMETYWPVTPLMLAPTLSLVLMYVVIHTHQLHRAVEQELQLAQMKTKISKQEAELSESRIHIMLSQIQPHFLFNTLTSISVLCERDPLKAQTALSDFSDYLRGNLDSLRRAAPVPFSKELKHVKTYIALEKMRFEEELQVVYDIEAEGFMLPALTVQPLVENAVKYGVGKKPGGGTVTIFTREQENSYLIRISDDGVGYDPTKTLNDGRTHIGIENVRSRLASMIGGTLTIESEKDKGTIATIQIPKGEEHEHSGCR